MVVPTPNGVVNPAILAAAKIAGVSEIYRVGGAQAIAALAFGTETIAPVAKITGPGNAYVAAAKRQVFGTVGIDMIAGPSEVLIIADGSANPAWVAADLLAQAEHGAGAQSILLTTDPVLARSVFAEVERQLATLRAPDNARQGWEEFGAIITVGTLDEAMPLANRIASEHVELALDDPEPWIGKFAMRARFSLAITPPNRSAIMWGAPTTSCRRRARRALHPGLACSISSSAPRFWAARPGLWQSLPTPRSHWQKPRGSKPTENRFDKAQPLMDKRPFDPETDRIVTVTLDPTTITSVDPDEVHEWRVAIYDLIDSNRFYPARVAAKGPYALHLSIIHNHIVLDVRHPETFSPIAAHYLSLTPFRSLIRDYFRIRESYYEAIRSASTFQIEAVDMAGAACTIRPPNF